MIKSEVELIKMVQYVATTTSAMAKKVLGRAFPIHSLTIFAHSPEEYDGLVKMVEKLGVPFNFNNGPRIALRAPINVEGNSITHLRIRKPDSARPQVGCNDFDADYSVFKKEFLVKFSQNLRLEVRPQYEMIELFHPAFDVLAYVVSDN